jgi:predicted Zn-dependent protease
VLFAQPARADQLLLDAEFSDAATKLTAPLRADLAPGTQVHFVIVANPDINAFVTGENVVYVHSGLIQAAGSASALQGVLAHELGHVAAHHLLQRYAQQKQAAIGAMAGAVLGLGAVAAGAGQAGMAVALGSQAGAIQSLLAHTRTQEAEADRRAINALHNAGLSANGMVEMFTKLRTESQLSYDAPPPWLVTHPLPPERLSNLQQVVKAESPGLKTALLKDSTAVNFTRLQAKVFALTATPGSVLRKYPGNSDVERYARAIAYMRQGRHDFSLSALAPLLKKNPDDAYYQEVVAQMAVDKGDLGTARTIFAKLTAAHPGNLLFHAQYAEVLRNQNDFPAALTEYEKVTRAWPEWSEPWQGLGLTYGNLGKLAESHLAMSESNLAAGNVPAAKQSLAVAQQYLAKAPSVLTQNWASTLQNRIDSLK